MSDRERLIIDGNAFYELDMDCVNRKRGRGDSSNNDKIQKSNVNTQKTISPTRLEK